MSGLARKAGAFGAVSPTPANAIGEAESVPAPNVDDVSLMSLALGIRTRLLAASYEDGDAASVALSMVDSWISAMRHHARHGRNWLGRHGKELGTRLKVVLPELFGISERELTGDELTRCAESVFGVRRISVGSSRWFTKVDASGGSS